MALVADHPTVVRQNRRLSIVRVSSQTSKRFTITAGGTALITTAPAGGSGMAR
jgi:hypothetical protein